MSRSIVINAWKTGPLHGDHAPSPDGSFAYEIFTGKWEHFLMVFRVTAHRQFDVNIFECETIVFFFLSLVFNISTEQAITVYTDIHTYIHYTGTRVHSYNKSNTMFMIITRFFFFENDEKRSICIENEMYRCIMYRRCVNILRWILIKLYLIIKHVCMYVYMNEHRPFNQIKSVICIDHSV